jgi:hypothetical protein
MRMRALYAAMGGVALAAVAAAAQQAGSRPGAAGRFPDAAAAVFELSNSMGMLRSVQQQDSIITLEQWGSGRMTAGAGTYDIPEYRMSVNYAVPGMRIDETRRAAGGAAERAIQVVSGGHAWDESSPGVGAVPAQAALGERLVRLWTTPMGVAKAARAAGAAARIFMREPGTTELVFALPPPVADVTATATLRTDASLLVAPHPMALAGLVGTYLVKVVTTGAVVSETTYAEYGDWNWSDYRADIFQPRKMVRKTGGATLEITTTHTNTYNPYVVMPVPERLTIPAGPR